MDFEHSTSQAADRPPGEVTQASGTDTSTARTLGERAVQPSIACHGAVDGAAKGGPTSLTAVTDLLLATDADWIADEVEAALSDPDTVVRRVRAGADVLPAVYDRIPDLVVLDSQIGNMGGVASCMALRHAESVDRLPPVPVLILLDRHADVFLARRSLADGWMIKPLDSFRIRRAVRALIDGDRYEEGVAEDDTEVTGSDVIAT
jgi:CheY-like chemotaxis protein